MAEQDDLQRWSGVYKDLAASIGGRIDRTQGTLTSLYENAVDRLIRLATQFTVLFLTGWVALMAASKLKAIDDHRILIGFCCFLHVLALLLIILNQWFVMVSYDRRSRDLIEAQGLLNSGSLSIQQWIAAKSVLPNDPNFLANLAKVEGEALGPFNAREKASISIFNGLNAQNWCLARGALVVFFASILASLSSMIILAR